MNQDRLKELINYDPNSGIFTWIRSINPRAPVGSVCGHINSNGYLHCQIDKKRQYLHRLAFLYMDGDLPPNEVDHINRIQTDNRWCNLRHSDKYLNARNRKNSHSFPGVRPVKDQRYKKNWVAFGVCVNRNEPEYLGHYHTHIAACYARWINELAFARGEK